jgi:uncharacterized protein YbaR (Trm112 family)
MVSQELLDILRCPNCVRNGPEAGLLEHRENWLICQDCSRKYPIRDDIPVMLIEEGTRFMDIPVEELPEIPPPEENKPLPAAPAIPSAFDERQKLILILVGAALGIGLFVFLIAYLTKKRSKCCD